MEPDRSHVRAGHQVLVLLCQKSGPASRGDVVHFFNDGADASARIPVCGEAPVVFQRHLDADLGTVVITLNDSIQLSR